MFVAVWVEYFCTDCTDRSNTGGPQLLHWVTNDLVSLCSCYERNNDLAVTRTWPKIFSHFISNLNGLLSANFLAKTAWNERWNATEIANATARLREIPVSRISSLLLVCFLYSLQTRTVKIITIYWLLQLGSFYRRSFYFHSRQLSR